MIIINIILTYSGATGRGKSKILAQREKITFEMRILDLFKKKVRERKTGEKNGNM